MIEDRHQHYRSQMVDLAHGELNLWDAARLRFHLRHCADCRREWEETVRLWGALRGLTPILSTHQRQKGIIMQTRIGLAVSTAIICIAIGSVASRFAPASRFQRQPPAQVLQSPDPERVFHSSFQIPNHFQFWDVRGKGRGRLIIRDESGKTMRSILLWGGPGPARDVQVKLGRLLNTPSEFSLALNETKKTRDVNGIVDSVVTCVPLTPAELTHMEALEEEIHQRTLDLYRKPECVGTDTPNVNGMGYTELPGLIAWSLDLWRNEHGGFEKESNGQPIRMENHGLAWKAYGNVRVTMTLMTGIMTGNRPYVYRYVAKPRNETSARQETPEIFWYQSAPYPRRNPAIKGMTYMVSNRFRYPIKPDGTFQKVKNSGRFVGYGTHKITDETGKLLMTLEVTPL